MNHLIVSREYPPAAYAHGGIGTYVQQMAELLATRGETVHVIAEQWDRAPRATERLHEGRLTVHRVPLARPRDLQPGERHPPAEAEILEAMAASEFPAQGFSWQAALLAETLVETAGIDVIEGQDFEAPLYYLLLRRAVGLGPARRPPCFVHLHGPWELVCRYNGWGLASAYDLTVARLEAYTIRAADALLCPSQYLADQVATCYGIARDSIERIPYPIGDTPRLVRTSETWERGPILYVGRMEPRKGVLEWIDAAVAMTRERPELRFEFVGADTTLDGQDDGPSVRAEVERRVPPDLTHAFSFHDAEPRPALWARLARAQLVVVPSRWDNFPNTGIEAMCSGLPVLASPVGGMSEIIEDGRTGWLAASNQPADLLAAVRRALDTPVDVRSRMGAAAAENVRALCDNTVTVDRHLVFRRRIMTAGAERSLRIAESSGAALMGAPVEPGAGEAPAGLARTTRPSARSGALEGQGIAVIVTGGNDADLAECLATLARQTHRPADVVVVRGDRGFDQDAGAVHAGERGWRVIDGARLPKGARYDVALDAMLDVAIAPMGVVIVDAACRLAPEFIEACEGAFRRNERLGLVSSWTAEGGDWQRLTIRPCPAWPYQWIMDDLSPCYAVRMVALRGVHWARDLLGPHAAHTDLALAILAEGWRAATYPALLSWRVSAPSVEEVALAGASRIRFREAFRDRWPRQDPQVLASLRALLESHPTRPSQPARSGRGSFTPQTVLQQPFGAQMSLLGRALRNPRYAAVWIGWHSRRAWHGALKRFRRSSTH